MIENCRSVYTKLRVAVNTFVTGIHITSEGFLMEVSVQQREQNCTHKLPVISFRVSTPWEDPVLVLEYDPEGRSSLRV